MRNPLKTLGDALSAAGEQDPETRARQGATSYAPGSVDEVPAPDDLADEFDFYRETPFVNAALRQFAADVMEPGVRVTADSDETADWFNGGDAAPDAPSGGFLSQAAVVAGERNQPLEDHLRQAVIQHEAAGNILAEKVKDDPTDSDPDYTGFMHIRPESVKLVTQENRPILLGPDDGRESAGIVTTRRGETAAYLQYHEGSILGQRDGGNYYADRDTVALSTNDVIKVARNPVPGEVWGESVIHPAADLIRGLKQILRDNEQAIQTKAYGIWSVAFGREMIEMPGAQDNELIEWGEQEQSEFVNDKIGREMGPGDIVGHDGNISFEKFEGEIANGLLDVIELYVKLIVTALPTPLYAVGIEADINQFVTAQQEPRYEKRVLDMRQTLAGAYEPALIEIAEQQGLSTEGLSLTIEPDEDASPIRSLDDEEMERIETFTTALKNVYGSGNATTYLDEEELADLVLQLPEEAIADSDVEEMPAMDETNPQVQAQFATSQPEEPPGPSPPPPESEGGTATDGGTDEGE